MPSAATAHRLPPDGPEKLGFARCEWTGKPIRAMIRATLGFWGV